MATTTTSLTLEQHEALVEQKSEEKIAQLPPGLSAEKLKGSLTAYKGKFTSAREKAYSNITTFDGVKREDYTENWRSILYKSKDDLNIYKNVLEWIFQNYLQVCDQTLVAAAENSSKDVNEKWLQIDADLTAAISKVEGALQIDARRHELELAKLKQSTSSSKSDSESRTVPRIASDLKPETRLDIKMNPVQLQLWLSGFGDYVRANQINTFKPSDQISYAKTMISEDLWTLILPKVTEHTQAAHFHNGRITFEQDDKGHDTIAKLLAEEWLRQYPLSTRRLELFKCKQTANQSLLTWLSNLELKFEAAGVKDMTPDLFMMYFALHGIYDSEVQKEAIKDFEDEKIQSINDLKKLARTDEVAARTSDYMKGKSEDKIFMTEYKRNKNKPPFQQPQRNAQKSQSGNTGNKNKSAQQRGRSQSKSRHRQSHHGQSKLWCDFHRTNTHNTNDCFAKQKANQRLPRGRSRERNKGRGRPRSPSPAYSSGSNASRSPSPKPKKQSISCPK